MKTEFEQKTAEMTATKEKEFTKLKTSLEAKVAAETKILNEESAKLKDDRNAFDLEKRSLLFEKGQSERVTLDIGGESYVTSIGTLTKTNCYFTDVFSGKIIPGKDEKGNIFIDRNGPRFGFILDYLRDGILPSPLPDITRQFLLKDAEFFKLDDLVAQLSI